MVNDEYCGPKDIVLQV